MAAARGSGEAQLFFQRDEQSSDDWGGWCITSGVLPLMDWSHAKCHRKEGTGTSKTRDCAFGKPSRRQAKYPFKTRSKALGKLMLYIMP